MEDYYKILNSCVDDSLDSIKQNYQKLLLLLHPDKQKQRGLDNRENGSDTVNEYHRLTRAWKVLSDSDLRKEYDARWMQRNTMQQWPVQEVVNFEEFEPWGDEEQYRYCCRCGGNIILTKTDALFQVDYVCCDICSLCVQVVYTSAPVSEVT